MQYLLIKWQMHTFDFKNISRTIIKGFFRWISILMIHDEGWKPIIDRGLVYFRNSKIPKVFQKSFIFQLREIMNISRTNTLYGNIAFKACFSNFYILFWRVLNCDSSYGDALWVVYPTSAAGRRGRPANSRGIQILLLWRFSSHQTPVSQSKRFFVGLAVEYVRRFPTSAPDRPSVSLRLDGHRISGSRRQTNWRI